MLMTLLPLSMIQTPNTPIYFLKSKSKFLTNNLNKLAKIFLLIINSVLMKFAMNSNLAMI